MNVYKLEKLRAIYEEIRMDVQRTMISENPKYLDSKMEALNKCRTEYFDALDEMSERMELPNQLK